MKNIKVVVAIFLRTNLEQTVQQYRFQLHSLYYPQYEIDAISFFLVLSFKILNPICSRSLSEQISHCFVNSISFNLLFYEPFHLLLFICQILISFLLYFLYSYPFYCLLSSLFHNFFILYKNLSLFRFLILIITNRLNQNIFFRYDCRIYFFLGTDFHIF